MLSIIGCLLLLLLSNCTTATDWGGDTYRRIYTLPGRHAHGGRLLLPLCGSGRGRKGQSYSINILGHIVASWALDGMQGLAPYTLYTRRHKSCHPSEGGTSLPRHTQLPSLLGLIIFKYYSCSVKTIIFGKKEIAYSHFIIVGFYCVGESKFTPSICYIDGYFIQTHTILLSLDSGRA